VVDHFADDDLKTLARDLEGGAEAYDCGLEGVCAIAAELRVRAVAGARKWPTPRLWQVEQTYRRD